MCSRSGWECWASCKPLIDGVSSFFGGWWADEWRGSFSVCWPFEDERDSAVSERRKEKGGKGEPQNEGGFRCPDSGKCFVVGFQEFSSPFYSCTSRAPDSVGTDDDGNGNKNGKAACIVETTIYTPVSSSSGQACRFVGSELLPLRRTRSYRHARPPPGSNVVTGLPPLSSSLPSLTHPPQDVLLLPTSSAPTILAVLQRLCISVWFARSRRRRRRRGTGDVQELYAFASRFEPSLPSSSSLSLSPRVSSRVAGRD